VAIPIAEGFDPHEFWYAYYRFREEGAEVVVPAVEPGTLYSEAKSFHDRPFEATARIEAVADQDFDLVYIATSITGSLRLRTHEPALRMVRKAMAENRFVCSICHGIWVLVSAGVLEGRTVACPRDQADDAIAAGATYVRDPAVRDGNLITAVYFAYLPEHFRLIMSAMLEER
jgi:protease I